MLCMLCYVYCILCVICSLRQCNKCHCSSSSSHLYILHHFNNITHCYLQVVISRLLPCPSLTSSRLFQCLSATSSSLHHCLPVIHSRSAIDRHHSSIVIRHSRISANLSSLSIEQCLRHPKVCIHRELYTFTYIILSVCMITAPKSIFCGDLSVQLE